MSKEKSHPPKNRPKKKDKHPPAVPPVEEGNSSPGRTVLIFVLILMVGVLFLLLYILYRPHKPHFAVMAAAVYNLNITSSALPPLVSASMQFTLMARNPNPRTGAFFDKLTAYVTYRDQPLMRAVGIPPLTLDKHEEVMMSPLMGGDVPVEAAEAVFNELEIDEAYGMVGMRVVIAGRLRWKAAGVSWSRHLSVKCDVLMGLKKGLVGRVPLLASPPCNVDA